MKTRSIIIGGMVVIGVSVFLYWRKTKSKPEPKPEIPKTPEALLKRLVERILEENAWKNERDFLSILSKNYIKEVKDITWIDYLPVSQEKMMETLEDVGLLGDYEKMLEEKYRRG